MRSSIITFAYVCSVLQSPVQGVKMDRDKIINTLKAKKDRFGVDQFVLFGSFASGANKANSDIDIAYKLKDNYKMTFDEYIKLEEELKESLHTKIDLMNYRKLNPLIKINAQKDFIYV